MSGVLGTLSKTAVWAVSYVLVWGALLAIASFGSSAGIAAALAGLIFFGVFLTQGITALQKLGVI